MDKIRYLGLMLFVFIISSSIAFANEEIWDCDEFYAKINSNLSGSFILMDDISCRGLDLKNNNSMIHGTFRGKIYGNGKILSDVLMNSTDRIRGIFYSMNGSYVERMIFENISSICHSGDCAYMGILSGQIIWNTTWREVGVRDSLIEGRGYLGIFSSASFTNNNTLKDFYVRDTEIRWGDFPNPINISEGFLFNSIPTDRYSFDTGYVSGYYGDYRSIRNAIGVKNPTHYLMDLIYDSTNFDKAFYNSNDEVVLSLSDSEMKDKSYYAWMNFSPSVWKFQDGYYPDFYWDDSTIRYAEFTSFPVNESYCRTDYPYSGYEAIESPMPYQGKRYLCYTGRGHSYTHSDGLIMSASFCYDYHNGEFDFLNRYHTEPSGIIGIATCADELWNDKRDVFIGEDEVSLCVLTTDTWSNIVIETSHNGSIYDIDNIHIQTRCDGSMYSFYSSRCTMGDSWMKNQVTPNQNFCHLWIGDTFELNSSIYADGNWIIFTRDNSIICNGNEIYMNDTLIKSDYPYSGKVTIDGCRFHDGDNNYFLLANSWSNFSLDLIGNEFISDDGYEISVGNYLPPFTDDADTWLVDSNLIGNTGLYFNPSVLVKNLNVSDNYMTEPFYLYDEPRKNINVRFTDNLINGYKYPSPIGVFFYNVHDILISDNRFILSSVYIEKLSGDNSFISNIMESSSLLYHGLEDTIIAYNELIDTTFSFFNSFLYSYRVDFHNNILRDFGDKSCYGDCDAHPHIYTESSFNNLKRHEISNLMYSYIRDNEIRNLSGFIRIRADSRENDIFNNKFLDTGMGLYLANGANGNYIRDNEFNTTNNNALYFRRGIFIVNSYDNLIYDNTFYGYMPEVISLRDFSSGNLIYDNSIISLDSKSNLLSQGRDVYTDIRLIRLNNYAGMNNFSYNSAESIDNSSLFISTGSYSSFYYNTFKVGDADDTTGSSTFYCNNYLMGSVLRGNTDICPYSPENTFSPICNLIGNKKRLLGEVVEYSLSCYDSDGIANLSFICSSQVNHTESFLINQTTRAFSTNLIVEENPIICQASSCDLHSEPLCSYQSFVLYPESSVLRINQCPDSGANVAILISLMMIACGLMLIGVIGSSSFFGIFGGLMGIFTGFIIVGCSSPLGMIFIGMSIVSLAVSVFR